MENKKWINEKLLEIPDYVSSFESIIDIDLQETIGASEDTGREIKLLDTANAAVSVYNQVLYWGLEFQATSVSHHLKIFIIVTGFILFCFFA